MEIISSVSSSTLFVLEFVRVGSTTSYITTYQVVPADVMSINGELIIYDIGPLRSLFSFRNPLPVTSSIRVDVVAPTVIFADTLQGMTDMEQMHPVTFSEVVTGFDTTDITTVSATVNSITGTGTTYTVHFTPKAAIFALTLAANSVTDRAGNEGPATPVTADGTAGTAVGGLDGDISDVSLDDAKFLYPCAGVGARQQQCSSHSARSPDQR